jgi:UDP-D-galactose:(glucosyl)LPS alpha-1,6-D-galactosyltransferase
LKIIIYSETLSGRGGIEKVISVLVSSLIKRQHEVLIILNSRSIDPTWEIGLPIVHLFDVGADYNDIDISNKLSEFIITKELTIVLGLSPKTVAIAKNTSKKHYDKVIVLSWLHFNIDFYDELEGLKCADGHLAISSTIQNDIQEVVGSHIPCKLVYVPVNVMNNPKIRASTETNFLYVGRVKNHLKRLDRLFIALAAIKREKKWTLTIVGDGDDKEILVFLASTLGITDRLVWVGWKEDPWEVVSECTALVLPSESEGQPLVLIEALSRGIPVIASQGIDIVNESNGWFYHSEDINQLRLHLEALIDRKATLPSSNDCVKSVDKFSVERITDLYVSAIFEISKKYECTF